MNTDLQKQITPLTRLAYGVGDIFGGGAMTLVGFYYAPFLTDVVRIDPRLAAVIYLVGRIWDAVTDPVMGFLSDRTKTRYGRRRPYFLAGVPLIIIACIFLWFPVNLTTEIGRFIVILLAYLFYSSVITMVMVPYSALAPEMTSDYGERSGLMTWRLILSNASSLVCAVLPPVIVSMVPDIRQGYLVMGSLFGLFFGLPYLLTFFVVREREEFRSLAPKFDFRNMVLRPFRMRSFRNTLTMYLFTMVSMDALMTMAAYLMKNYLQPETDFEIFLGVMILAMMLGTVAFSRLGQKKSKRTAFSTGAIIWSLLMIFTLLLGPDWSDFGLFTAFTLVGFFMGGPIVMVYSIMADVPDVDELHTGERREGTYSGLLTFCRKASSAVAGFIVLQLIGWGGYRLPVEIVENGVTTLTEQVQPVRFILTLRLLFAFLPVLFSAVALLGALRYRLSPAVYRRLQVYLKVNRGKMNEKTGNTERKDLLDLLGE